MLRETEMSIRRRAEVVDQLAAVLILESFMEFRKSSRQSREHVSSTEPLQSHLICY